MGLNPRNDLSRGTYITDPFGSYPPTLPPDQPLGTGQEYRVPVGTYAPTALAAPRTASTPSIQVSQQPNPLGGTNPTSVLNVPLVLKAPGSTAQMVGDVAQSTSAEQSNRDLIREALSGGEPGYNRLDAGRFSQGPKGFLQQGYSPGGNSWMWFTGGSPFPVQEGPQIVDASTEILRNINASMDYEKKRKRYEEEQARRDAQKGGQRGSQQGSQNAPPGDGTSSASPDVNNYLSDPTSPVWGDFAQGRPNPFLYARTPGPGF